MLDFIDNHKPFSAAFATIVILLTLFGTTKKAGTSASEQTQSNVITNDACADSLKYQQLFVDALKALDQNGINTNQLSGYDLDAVVGHARDSDTLVVARTGECFLIINTGTKFASVHAGTMEKLP
jgi:uncharacterized lipoprotein NlpE involved in copper resistance